MAFILETFYENSNYKSGWRPLIKESSLNAVGSFTETGASGKNAETGRKRPTSPVPESPAAEEAGGKQDFPAAEIEKKQAVPVAGAEKRQTVFCPCAVGAETANGSGKESAAPAPAESETPEQSDIRKELSRIGADIDTMNRRLLRQGEKIDSLLQMMEKAAEKRSIFHAEKK